MKTVTKNNLIRSTFTALFAALICVGCIISIPMPSGVPITVQNMFSILSGVLLGGIQGAGAVGIFIVLGAVGLPVYSGAVGGINILVGPTGGYIWGYFLGALISGIIVGTPHVEEKKFKISTWIRIAIATVIGYLIVYIPGVPWFRHIVLSNPENSLHNILSGLSVKDQFTKVLGWTVLPYLPGDIIKIIITIPLAAILRPVAARYLYPNDKKEEEELIEKIKNRK